MSLSKYFKSTESFQPDELLKRENSSTPGWNSDEQRPPGSFQAQERPAQQGLKKSQPPVQPPGQQEMEGSNSPKSPLPRSPQAKENNLVSPPPSTEDPKIDLNNYLKKEIAEQKIEQAYQQGIKAGQEGVDQDFLTATNSLLSICQQLDTIRETIIANSSEELHNFALSIAERILRISVLEQDKTIVATIEEALQRAVKSDEFTIYIHPNDYQTVAENSSNIVAGLTGLNKIVIKQDSSIERGGAKIESENCTIDATIASQFDVIKEEILKDL